MKNRLLSCGVALLISQTAFAQYEQSVTTTTDAPPPSSSTESVLPEKGDIAVAIDANPFLEYAGKLLSDTGSTAPAWNYLTNNQTITGKYFLKENMAIRGSVRLGFASANSSSKTVNRSVGPNALPKFPLAPLADVYNTSSVGGNNIGLAGGVEWRRGYGRLQGFFGGELGISFASNGATYTYANPLTQFASNADLLNVNVDPTGDLIDGNNITVDPYGNPARVLNRSSGTTFGLGVRGFIGAEYFVMPKLSVGGEFGWGAAVVSTGTQTQEIESEGDLSGTETRATFKSQTKGATVFALDSENLSTVFGPAGRLRLTLHF